MAPKAALTALLIPFDVVIDGFDLADFVLAVLFNGNQTAAQTQLGQALGHCKSCGTFHGSSLVHRAR